MIQKRHKKVIIFVENSNNDCNEEKIKVSIMSLVGTV